MLVFNVPQLKEYSDREEPCGLECSLKQGIFGKFWISLKLWYIEASSAPRIPIATGGASFDY
ncbi:hypothetical protein N431DRAFT_435233 [Stipitochalara longipes BDJ]|nr:hypothetical protein N431DRAFT_435233 [Stipitochalara longipes BDJ]